MTDDVISTTRPGEVSDNGRRVSAAWIAQLQPCNMTQAKRMILHGAILDLYLDETSTKTKPVWRATVLDGNGHRWILISDRFKTPRLLGSPQRIYQVARNLGLKHVNFPVET